MGYMVELNTLLRGPIGFDVSSLSVGKRHTITIDRERAFPLHIALLLIDCDWNFYGYCVAHSCFVKNSKTQLDFEMLTIFTPEVQTIYRQKFLAAARMTGEIH